MANFHIKILVICFLLMAVTVHAQQNLTLFLMHDVAYANIVNPAIQNQDKWIVGFPGVSSVHAGYNNTAFSLDDILVNNFRSDSLYLRMDNVVYDMNNIELIKADFFYTPFYVGFWNKSSYLTFSVTEKISSFAAGPKEAAELGWYGNTLFLGREASFDKIRTNAMHLREYAFGWAKELSERLTLGFHAKVLFGKGIFYVPYTYGGLTTDERNFNLLYDLSTKVETSLPVDVSIDDEGYVSGVSLQDNFQWGRYLMNRKNLGLGFDFGFIYKLNEETTLSGSILNIGFVNWRSNVNTFNIDGTMRFTGTDSSTDFHNSLYVEELRDSLYNQFIPNPISESFSTSLVPETYIGISKVIDDHIKGGAVLYSRFNRSKIQPAITLSANTYNYKAFSAALSYTAINGDYFNIGAGLGLNFGVFQFHLTGDNMLGFLNMAGQRNLNVRFGLAIVSKEKKRFDNKKGIKPLPCINDPYKKYKRHK